MSADIGSADPPAGFARDPDDASSEVPSRGRSSVSVLVSVLAASPSPSVEVGLAMSASARGGGSALR